MDHDEIRTLSSFLYGNVDRLRVAASIGRLAGKPISARAVADDCGLDYNRVQEQVAWFKRAGVLIPDFDSSSRRKDYRAVDIGYWAAAARLEEELQHSDDLG